MRSARWAVRSLITATTPALAAAPTPAPTQTQTLAPTPALAPAPTTPAPTTPAQTVALAPTTPALALTTPALAPTTPAQTVTLAPAPTTPAPALASSAPITPAQTAALATTALATTSEHYGEEATDRLAVPLPSRFPSFSPFRVLPSHLLLPFHSIARLSDIGHILEQTRPPPALLSVTAARLVGL